MDPDRRLSLLVTSPRVAAGLLSHEAWQACAAAVQVYARSTDPGTTAACIEAAGSLVRAVGDEPTGLLARRLLDAADSGQVVWVGSADADPGLSEALAAELTSRTDPPELELLVGSWDLPGSRLLDAVAVMDRLRSPGGCPWDAEQTHASLVPHLVEETFECVEALEAGDAEHAVEELGDVLLQVLFHARVAEDEPDGYDIDDVAAGLVDKLIRRHPHVFSAASADNPQDVQTRWSELKAAEKPERSHPLDGIPAGMPDLARADTAAARLRRAGYGAWLEAYIGDLASAGDTDADIDADDGVAAELLTTVVRAQGRGVDPAAALRRALRRLAETSPVENPAANPAPSPAPRGS